MQKVIQFFLGSRIFHKNGNKPNMKINEKNNLLIIFLQNKTKLTITSARHEPPPEASSKQSCAQPHQAAHGRH